MTRKEIQEMDNDVVLELYHEYASKVKALSNGVQLRHCSAIVYETSDYYILKSYNTVVAFIIKEDDILVDALRYVYGYTSTSAQHIAKFNNDYGHAKYGCVQRITYRPL